GPTAALPAAGQCFSGRAYHVVLYTGDRRAGRGGAGLPGGAPRRRPGAAGRGGGGFTAPAGPLNRRGGHPEKALAWRGGPGRGGAAHLLARPGRGLDLGR